MSALSNPMPAIDPRAYDPQRAEWIALQFASGEPDTSLSALARAFPDTVPPPLILRRWRSTFPAFDALMREAEAARAHALMDATLPIADDETKNAAQAKNAITARWRLAEALAPETFASRSAKSPDGDARDRLLGSLSDAALMRIIAGADPSALLLENDPAHPPLPPAVSGDGAKGGNEVRPPTPSFISPRASDLVGERAESELAYELKMGS